MLEVNSPSHTVSSRIAEYMLLPDLFTAHQKDVDCTGRGDGSEGNQASKDSTKARGDGGHAGHKLVQTHSKEARGGHRRNVSD